MWVEILKLFQTIILCVANHVRAHIAQLEHKYLRILGISVRAEWVFS